MVSLRATALLAALVAGTAGAVPMAQRRDTPGQVVRGDAWNELPLELYSSDGSYNKTVAFGDVRDKAGYKVLDMSGHKENFTFYGVGAHVLGTSSIENGVSDNEGRTIVYGQLTPTAYPNRCVTAHALNTKSPSHFSSAPCIFADDKSIKSQIWQLRLVPHCTGPHCAHEYAYDYQLHFIGGEVPTNDLGYYTLAPVQNDHQSLGVQLGEDRKYELHFAS